jgi:HlyD family secretion protein
MKQTRTWGLALAALLTAGCAKQEEPAEKPVVAVRVARAVTGTVQISVVAPATVWPQEQASVAARITAPIRELRVRKGDRVAAGQVLAVLEDRDIRAQREEAAAALTDAEANLEKTMAGTLPSDIEHARGLVETSQAALDLARQVAERRADLFRQGAIPQRDLQQSQTELAQARTNFEVASRSLELLRRQSGEKDIAIARSRVAQAKARLSQTDVQLQFTELRSPFAGTVTDQLQYPGDMASPSTPTFTVMDLAQVNARAQIPESQVGRIQAGQPCEFHPVDSVKEPRPPASELSPHNAFTGKITVINKAVDPARRTVEVWCQIPNPQARLRGNTFGDVSILTGSVSDSVLVPLAAVQLSEGTLNGTVLVVEKNVAHAREVEAGEKQGGLVRIKSGVKAGETVVTQGGYGLADGTAVTLAEGQ